MTSVPNRQQPLNGNNILILLVFAFFLASCGGSKKVVDNNNRNESTVENTDQTDYTVDTIRWTRVSKSEVPPITGDNVVIDSRKKDVYSIAVLIPFGSSSFDFTSSEIDESSEHFRFINYYAGMQLALEELESKGMSFVVNVFDTESLGGNINALVNSPEVSNADVIIGPYSSENLKVTARQAKRNESVLVSPWRASTSITDDNPYYIQLRPNLSSYYYALVEDALKNYRADQVFLIGRDKSSDQNRINRFQSYVKDINGPNAPLFNEFIINEDSLKIGDTAFDSLFLENETTVIIIPNWSFSADESFIYNCLRKLNIEKGTNDVVVYGMPIMIDSEKIDFNFYRNLNMRVARSKFVDNNNEDVKAFKRKYFNAFRGIPSDDAFEGFDVMRFVGENLFKNGTKFQFFLGESKQDFLQMSFDIQKRLKEGVPEDLDPEKFSYFENTYLDIYKFVEDRFVKAN